MQRLCVILSKMAEGLSRYHSEDNSEESNGCVDAEKI